MFSPNDPNYSPKAGNEWMHLFHWKHIAIKVRFPNKLIMFTFDVIFLLSLTKVWKIALITVRETQKGSTYIPKCDFEFPEKFPPEYII